MKLPVRAILSAVLVLSLAACSSGGGDDDTAGDGDIAGGSDTADGDDGADGGGDEVATDDDIDLTDATPRINVGMCNTLEVAETAASTDLATPAQMVEGQLVRGRINPEIPSNDAQYWTIDLEAGFYHVIADSQRADGDNSNIRLQINDVDASGESIESLLDLNVVDIRARQAEFFLISEPRTVTLEITSLVDDEDYVFGVFANGRTIPSPFFEDCPTITGTSVDTTEAFALQQLNEPADVVWYQLDLEETNYTIDTSGSRQDGTESNVFVVVDVFSGFGETRDRDMIQNVNAIGTVTNQIDEFDIGEPDSYWVTFENSPIDENQNFEFTINEQ